MKILRNLIIGACATMATALPSVASTYSHKDLIDLLDNNGIPVTINNSTYCDGTIYGNYRFSGIQRQMNLCPGAEIDDHDLSTLRHETWHAIQHCVNSTRGTDANTPVNTDIQELVEVVNTILPHQVVSAIKAGYPQEHWLVEFEANVVERILTAEELANVFIETCTLR
jgi:hypothetical protein